MQDYLGYMNARLFERREWLESVLTITFDGCHVDVVTILDGHNGRVPSMVDGRESRITGNLHESEPRVTGTLDQCHARAVDGAGENGNPSVQEGGRKEGG